VKYICTEDIENLAAQGKNEIVLDEQTVLMDLAREMAQRLGITISVRPRPIAAKAAPPVSSVPPLKTVSTSTNGHKAAEAEPKLVAKPKGCQHGPLPVSVKQANSNGHQSSDGVVSQLVELIRNTNGRHSGPNNQDR
jgi:hypothetical protein